MTAQVWATIAFGLANMVVAIVALVRAGRAGVIAERAERRAVSADERAEEAHAILKTRFATDQEREQAALEAPGIVERWIAELNAATQAARQLRSRHAAIQVNLSTLGDRLALNILREKREALSIREISVGGNVATITRIWQTGVTIQR